MCEDHEGFPAKDSIGVTSISSGFISVWKGPTSGPKYRIQATDPQSLHRDDSWLLLRNLN